MPCGRARCEKPPRIGVRDGQLSRRRDEPPTRENLLRLRGRHKMGAVTEAETEGAVDEGRAMQSDIRRRAMEALATKRADMAASLTERLAERLRESLDLTVSVY